MILEKETKLNKVSRKSGLSCKDLKQYVHHTKSFKIEHKSINNLSQHQRNSS